MPMLGGIALVVAFVLYLVLFYDNGLGGFKRLPITPRPPESRPEGTLRTVHFPGCDGTMLKGWLVTPATTPAPLVVMAPGLTGTKGSHLESYAWRSRGEGSPF